MRAIYCPQAIVKERRHPAVKLNSRLYLALGHTNITAGEDQEGVEDFVEDSLQVIWSVFSSLLSCSTFTNRCLVSTLCPNSPSAARLVWKNRSLGVVLATFSRQMALKRPMGNLDAALVAATDRLTRAGTDEAESKNLAAYPGQVY